MARKMSRWIRGKRSSASSSRSSRAGSWLSFIGNLPTGKTGGIAATGIGSGRLGQRGYLRREGCDQIGQQGATLNGRDAAALRIRCWWKRHPPGHSAFDLRPAIPSGQAISDDLPLDLAGCSAIRGRRFLTRNLGQDAIQHFPVTQLVQQGIEEVAA